MLDFYYANSGNSLRAAIALKECGLPYDSHKLDLENNAHKASEFLEINPFGTVPVLIEHRPDGEAPIILTQSAAIVTFAAESADLFIPSSRAERAEVMRWFMVAITDVQPTSQLLLYLTKNVPDFSDAAQKYLENRWLTLMRAIEGHLAEGGGGYLCGSFSIADIALFPVVKVRRQLLERTGGFPTLLLWMERMTTRPAVLRALEA